MAKCQVFIIFGMAIQNYQEKKKINAMYYYLYALHDVHYVLMIHNQIPNHLISMPL